MPILLPALIPGVSLRAMTTPIFRPIRDEANGHVLVLIQLNGGNDGLNTVIPLHIMRRTIVPGRILPSRKIRSYDWKVLMERD